MYVAHWCHPEYGAGGAGCEGKKLCGGNGGSDALRVMAVGSLVLRARSRVWSRVAEDVSLVGSALWLGVELSRLEEYVSILPPARAYVASMEAAAWPG